ncbi:UNVERIFIED_CONTAM: putative protein PAM68-like [Sesamum radiatum]|uniref:Uncharacterized protein n=1 Tax=Sesamum radiatum TaxID=300843 RepID=A0AAW2KD32_SESRA
MKTLTILQQITPSHITKPTPWPQSRPALHHNRRGHRSRQELHGGAKGFTGVAKGRETIARKSNYTERNEEFEEMTEVVWERMISRILVSVGVPLGIGFALQAFGVLKEQEVWDVPKWLPFLTTFITFGASALGIAYGSLSTSLEQRKT